MEEVWKDINGYEDLYQVSNLGRVKSLNYIHSGTEKILSPKTNNNGYLSVLLSKNCVKKMYLVHRLVAQAFILNPNSLPQVNHINENKTDNRVVNLEWCTASYNINYGNRIKKTSRPVKQLTLDGTLVAIWPSAQEAQRNGFNQSTICKCCIGLINKHKGYKWQYAS